MIGFKTWRQLQEFRDLHPTLEDVLQDLLHFWPTEIPFVITDIGRTHEEDDALNASGIHSAGPPWRALDFRTRTVADDLITSIAEDINDRWIYDPSRPGKKVLFHLPHGTGPHGHLQVHPETRIA